ncbi:MAG: DUF1343 domain-containing protein [Lachnospiraceae bacterium]|nr:DUF1343 domain-containing protein [Lachnospiraceae bacterium]
MKAKARKTIIFILLFSLIFTAAGCGKNNDESAANDISKEDKGLEVTENGVTENGVTENGLSVTDKDLAENSLSANEKVVLGDECFDEYIPLLEGKRVALYSNQTGVVRTQVTYSEVSETMFDSDFIGVHILDALISKGVNVTLIFSPEHGFRGDADAGASVDDSLDAKTGVPIKSLYGGGSITSDGAMDKFDTLVIDIQDIGVRYYTYYITMYNLMNECADAGKSVILLDRPNPNGFYVDGPILKDEFKSGVGMLKLPVVHGMTLGELALMINGEGWLRAGADSLDLTVIKCKDYCHNDLYKLVKRPSPNLKDMRAVYLYPSTCYFENTVVSVGRGTEYPFEIYGSPYFEGIDGYDYLFTPVSMEGAKNPQYEGITLTGKSLLDTEIASIQKEGINLEYLISAYADYTKNYSDGKFFGNPDKNGHYWIDLLMGTDEVRLKIVEGVKAEDFEVKALADEIEDSWKDELTEFSGIRGKYLLYE